MQLKNILQQIQVSRAPAPGGHLVRQADEQWQEGRDRSVASTLSAMNIEGLIVLLRSLGRRESVHQNINASFPKSPCLLNARAVPHMDPTQISKAQSRSGCRARELQRRPQPGAGIHADLRDLKGSFF